MTKKKNIRKIALSMLMDYEQMGRYVNLSLNSHAADGLTREERASLTALLYTTVEHKLTYDYYISAFSKRQIDKIDFTTRNILRLGLCQLIDLKGIPSFAAVNETVSLARNSGERSFVNAVLRSAERSMEELPLPDKEKNTPRYLSVKYSVSLWIVKRFVSLYGKEECEKLLEFISMLPTTDVTVNTVKTTREALCQRFLDEGCSAEISALSPNGIRIIGSVDVRLLSGYSSGEFFVEDTASSAAVAVLSPKPCDRVVDVCSAPGGKSFAAAVHMDNKGEIFSFDIHENKLSLIESGKERLGLNIIKSSECDATNPKEELFGTADCVICDVVCSGLGVIRKKPDMRYKSEEGISNLPALQYEILENSSKYLKPGGRILYSTCTLLKEENEEVVERFLTEHKDFHAKDFEIGCYKSEGGCFTFIPHIHKTDGFFVSLMEKDYI